MNDEGASIPLRRTRVLCRLVSVVLAAAVFCCGDATAAATSRARHDELIAKHQRGDRDVLRMREDVQRRRLWVLTAAHLYVYDTANSTLLRRVSMPRWSIADADYLCAPDIALDSRGTAFVSSNVEPRLLKIEPVHFRTTEHRLLLASKRQWEVGFGSLAFASDGALYALSAVAGVVFRIDVARGTAAEIAAAARPVGACALTLSGDG